MKAELKPQEKLTRQVNIPMTESMYAAFLLAVQKIPVTMPEAMRQMIGAYIGNGKK